ncbi:MAG: CCA tRNA nucleotidyltransferase [Syntrophomonadaceae bacterium]|jgi:tRNA nucleotidyltransferase (CCA-adding enzyme)
MIEKIAYDIAAHGGRAFFTGGFVRDYLLTGQNNTGKDIDIEIFGLNQDELLTILNTYGRSQIVGKSFPIIKLKKYPQWDFTLPLRTDISYHEACARRDFTINAMMIDILSGEILDFLGGQRDLKNRLIRHTNKHVFLLDPLRAYRAVQLAARLEFQIDSTTLEIVKYCSLDNIKPERILQEIGKLLLLGKRPSIGLRYMQEAGILERRHPMLFNLINCEQSPVNHPEGDVWEHTLKVVDVAASLKHKSRSPEVLMFAALLHDLGKPATTRNHEGKTTAYGHDVKGKKLAHCFLNDLNASNRLIAGVSKLVKEHMHPVLLYKNQENVSDKAIRKLVNRVNVKELLLLAEADFRGRGQERDFKPVEEWLNHRIKSIGLNPEEKIEPLIKGRDLIKLGLTPGSDFRRILDMAFALQLEGKSRQEILEWLSNIEVR